MNRTCQERKPLCTRKKRVSLDITYDTDCSAYHAFEIVSVESLVVKESVGSNWKSDLKGRADSTNGPHLPPQGTRSGDVTAGLLDYQCLEKPELRPIGQPGFRNGT